MRGTVTIPIPAGMTPRQLTALASLAGHLRDHHWRYLSASFDRLDGTAGQWPPAMAAVLGQLDRELRREAADREQAAAEVAPEAGFSAIQRHP